MGRICIPDSDYPRVVVVGGGFAGLNLVKRLKNMPVQVVLIDKNNFHQFLPLLYQVATSGIEPDNIVFPFRKLFNQNPNVLYRMAEATGIDAENKRLNSTIGYIKYDYLVLAGGSAVNFFGNSGFENFGQGLKTITDALDIRSKLLQNLEKATITCIKEEKQTLSSVAIVGGGPAGVELAGAFAEFKKYILPKDYPELKNVEMKIYLLEASDRILQWMPGKLSEKALKYLTAQKVDVMLNAPVKSFNGSTVTLQSGKNLNAAAFIWTAGVKGSSIEGLPSGVKTRQNRLAVDEFNRIQSLDKVFAIGDIAQMKTENYPSGHPMVAQTAIQQGKALAANLMKILNKEPLIPFEYHDKGSMATIGKKRAVAKIKNLETGGFNAWLIWSFIHLMSILGIRNKILVAINWLWSYFTYDKGDRVIIRRAPGGKG
ncbi:MULTISPECIES: NAD(P)/FAD-dependent oxidoreductase [Marinilabilia]|nr:MULTISPECIES: NAD(P)/FAD-dependent oxidoreductase [Marinilabilia]